MVCDGFVGNVALKTSEGLARLVRSSLRESLKSTVTSQVGALLSKKAFDAFKKRLDYSEYGRSAAAGCARGLHCGAWIFKRTCDHEWLFVWLRSLRRLK